MDILSDSPRVTRTEVVGSFRQWPATAVVYPREVADRWRELFGVRDGGPHAEAARRYWDWGLGHGSTPSSAGLKTGMCWC